MKGNEYHTFLQTYSPGRNNIGFSFNTRLYSNDLSQSWNNLTLLRVLK